MLPGHGFGEKPGEKEISNLPELRLGAHNHELSFVDVELVWV